MTKVSSTKEDLMATQKQTLKTSKPAFKANKKAALKTAAKSKVKSGVKTKAHAKTKAPTIKPNSATEVKPAGVESKKYWLMKTEPDVFSIENLRKNKTTLWEGVRNYQARNYMTSMEVGDAVLFYHSSCEVPGVAGLAVVSKKAVPDPTQFDKKSEYYDAKATQEKPIWYCVEVQFVTEFNRVVSLEEIKNDKALATMLVIRKGQRLSIQPATQDEFDHIHQLSMK
jgi:predicted RNA-binding protein with PUA-like domain